MDNEVGWDMRVLEVIIVGRETEEQGGLVDAVFTVHESEWQGQSEMMRCRVAN